MCLFSPCTGQIPRKNAVLFASPSLPILTFDTEAVSIFPGQNTRFVKRPVTPIAIVFSLYVHLYLYLCTSCVVESGWRHSSLYTTYMNSASAQWVPIPLAPKLPSGLVQERDSASAQWVPIPLAPELPSCSATSYTPTISGYQSHRRSRPTK